MSSGVAAGEAGVSLCWVVTDGEAGVPAGRLTCRSGMRVLAWSRRQLRCLGFSGWCRASISCWWSITIALVEVDPTDQFGVLCVVLPHIVLHALVVGEVRVGPIPIRRHHVEAPTFPENGVLVDLPNTTHHDQN